MGKTITIPNNITYSTIKSNSDVGNLSDNGDGTFDVTNITTTEIRNILGEDTNSVGTLSTSPKINRWSLFKPDRNKISSGSVVYSPTSPYPMGEFAAYDHEAPVNYATHTNDYKEYSPTRAGIVFSFNWEQKQMNWYDELNAGGYTVTHLIFLLKDTNDNILDKDSVPLEDKAGDITYHTEISGIGEGDYVCELWFGESGGSGTLDQIVYAPVPDNEWQVNLTVVRLKEPTCSLKKDGQDGVWDTNNDGYDEIGLTVEGSNVETDDSYSLSFHFDNEDPKIVDGKIYASKNAGSWQLVEDNIVWTFADPTHTHSGTAPFNIDYGDNIVFFLSTRNI